jgi:hypothetical protein
MKSTRSIADIQRERREQEQTYVVKWDGAAVAAFARGDLSGKPFNAAAMGAAAFAKEAR